MKKNLHKPSKYKNKKVEYDGVLFDSKKEMKRYIDLKLLQRAQIISGLSLQQKFVLQEGFNDHFGERHRPISYKADFVYTDANGDKVVEDTKGMKTDVYRIKKKLFIFKYPEYKFLET